MESNELFLLMLQLLQKEDKNKLVPLFIDGIKQIWPQLEISYQPLLKNSNTVKQNGETVIPLKTVCNFFGSLTLNPAFKALNKEEQLILENAIKMLTLFMENNQEKPDFRAPKPIINKNKEKGSPKKIPNKTEPCSFTQNFQEKQKTRAEIEAELKKSNDFILAITDSAQDCIYCLDREGRFTFTNSAFCQLMRKKKEDILNKKAAEIFPEDTGREIQWIIDSVFQGNIEHLILEFEIEKNPLRFHSILAPLVDDQGDAYSLCSIMRDITLQQQVVLENRELQKQLHQAEKMQAIGQLAGGIAHDFNNQLAGIIGYSELLLDEAGSQPVLRKYAKNINQAANHASDLTGKLLAFARKGKYTINAIDLHLIIDDVISILERSINKKISLRRDFQAYQAHILGDYSQIQNALLNIGLNARDALPKGGEIIFHTEVLRPDSNFYRKHSLSYQPEKFYLKLSIADNGTGMSGEVKKHIFEPFFTTKEVGKGTGMGLAAVYGTVKGHEGLIEWESEAGRGTVFYFYFPLYRKYSEKLPARDINRKKMEKDMQKKKIIIIDDEYVVRAMLDDLFISMDFEVKSFSRSREAMKYFQENHDQSIDIILLDLIMPEVDGAELFKLLRVLMPQVPVLFISGYSMKNSLNQIMQEKGVYFIAKPFRSQEIRDKVLSIIKERENPS